MPLGQSQPEAATAVSGYRALVARRLAFFVGGVSILAVLVLVDLLVGPAFLDPSGVVLALVNPQAAEGMTAIIVWDIRLPMTLMAIVVGVSLSIAGVLMQTILGNPLASPYTLGISAAAGFGAALTILTGFTLPFFAGFSVALAAFCAAGLASALVYAFSRLSGMSAEVMVLAGIATLFLFQSAQSLVQYLAAPEVLQAIVFWLFGSLLKANWENLPISAGILLLSLLVLLPLIWKLTALRLGDERASAVGVDVRRLRIKVFVLVTLLTAGSVAFVGTIGFVGLVAPHIARMLVGEDQRFLLPMAAVSGAVVMVGASILSKLISPGGVLPIGIVTAVIGVPFLFFLIVQGRRRYW
ncbi:MAG: iron ABC transporter permease [Pseudomonadota bacterium]